MDNYLYQFEFMQGLAELCIQHQINDKSDFDTLVGTLIDLLAATNAAVQLSEGTIYDILEELQEADHREPKFQIKA